jgi:hypothetical protein
MTCKVCFMVTSSQTRTHDELAQASRSKGPLTVLVASGDGGIRERRVRATDRLSARLRASRLDRDLSRGASPESSVALALHARTLVGAPVREGVLRGLRRLIAVANGPARRPSVPVYRARVASATDDLEAICDRLVVGGPVSARGMAQLRTLLADGGGPLYQRKSRDDLAARLQQALSALDGLTTGGDD